MMNNSSREPTPGRPNRRPVWAVMLAVGLAVTGLAIGTALGAKFFVPEGSGLAGPVIALGYGLLGLLLGMLLAGLVAWKASMGVLRTLTVSAFLMALLIIGLGTWRVMTQDQIRSAELGLDQPLPEPADWTLSARVPEKEEMRSYRELEIDASDWSFEHIAVGPEAARCKGSLIAREAATLMRLVNLLMNRSEPSAPLCPQQEVPILFVSLRGGSGSQFLELEAGAQCLRDNPVPAELAQTLRRIPIDAVSHVRVECQ